MSSEPAVSVLLETEPDTWEDISDRLISGSTRRGRQRELDRYQAGTCELLLDNDDRALDPTHEDSPLYGYVRPMRRIQLTATWDGDTYPLFAGYADRWTQNREGPYRGTVSLQATDGFKVLAKKMLAASVYAHEVLLDGPTHWWRLDEPSSSPLVLDAVSDRDGTPEGTVTLGDPTLISRDAGAAMSGDTIGDLVRLPVGAGPAGTGPFTIELVIQTNTDPSARGRVFASAGTSAFEVGVGAFAIGVSPPYMWVGATTILGDYSAESNIGDGAVHHLAYVREADGDLLLYVDGVDVTGTPATSTDNIAATHTWDFGTQRLSTEDVISGVFDELAVYDYALSAARIAAHADAVYAPWDGDTPEDRIVRVLDAVDWPAAARDLDTGIITLQPATLATSALEHIHKVAESEFGLVYVTADGTLRFEERAALVNQTAVADFEDTAATGLGFSTSSPEIADDLLRNEVTVSRVDGVAQTVRDDASIAEYLIASYTLDGLFHDNDVMSRHAAEFIVSEYATPGQRVNSLTVNPYHDPDALWPAVLGLELTDWVTVTETPQHTGDPWTKTLAVEGIAHQFGPKEWATSLDLSPGFGTGDGDDCILQLDTGPCGLDDARLWF